MNGWIDTNVLRNILDISDRGVRQAIQRGRFTTAKQINGVGKYGRSIGKNGKIWQIHIDDPAIPESARAEWKKSLAAQALEAALSSDPAALIQALSIPDTDFNRSIVQSAIDRQQNDERTIEARRQKAAVDMARFNQLPEKKRQSAQAKHDLLNAVDLWLKVNGYPAGSQHKIKLFCHEYASGMIPLPPAIRTQIKKISPSTIFRWRTLYNEGGLLALAENYKTTKGDTSLSKEQQDLAISMQVKFPGCSAKHVAQAMEARNMPASLGSIRRFVSRWLKMNESLHLLLTNPDKWKNQHMVAHGSASEAVSRLNELWEMDSTPGDIMLEDGRFTVIGCIDVYSRRLRLLVSPTSKAVSVAALIRRCLIEWGVPETIKTDNGKDYVAAHIERILEALEIAHHLCPPFTPEVKPHIERAFHTFSHGIVELLPGYIGHSVTDRKAIEARKSFSERLMKRGSEVAVTLTSLEFQKICDRWVDALYMQNDHSSLAGKTPAEMVREWQTPIPKVADERALDILLTPAPGDGGFRTVNKKGIRVDNRNYISPALGEWSRRQVGVRLDDTNLGYAYIYSEEGAFICVAECPTWRGVSPAELANHAKARQKAIMLEQKKELSELVKKAKVDTIPEEILTYREERIATIAEFPKPSVPHITPSLEEAAKAYLERDYLTEKKAPEHIELPEDLLERERIREEKVVKLAESRKFRDVQGPSDIYYELLSKIKDGTITAYERQWKEGFEHWDKTGNKTGVFKTDKWLLNDPESAMNQAKSQS
jgi:transposase InsO family protein